MFKKVDAKVNFPKMEEEILEYWEKEKVFEKSVSKEAPKGDFVFYEGPPTANGKPGLHHVLARSFKDIIPRYKTMKGYRVRRKAGWDTHGLPVELQVEKALGLRSKQEIENIVPGDARASVIEFNKKCKESVWEYREAWEKFTKRMGYWSDMEHPYVTYENGYIESVWWQLARIAKLKTTKGEDFLYKGHKVVSYCYRCGTALSSHEVAQGYKEVIDNSVYVKFQLQAGQKIGDFEIENKVFMLAWTTTPWTLPGNVALAVNPNIEYVLVKVLVPDDEGTIKNGMMTYDMDKEYLVIVAKDLLDVFSDPKSWLKIFKGSELVNLKYSPLFSIDIDDIRNHSLITKPGSDESLRPQFATRYINDIQLAEESALINNDGKELEKYEENTFRILPGKFVDTKTGTGVVHIASAYGEEDALLAKENNLPTLHIVNQNGTVKYISGLEHIAGIPVKKLDGNGKYKVDNEIIKNLENRKEGSLIYASKPYKHEYPFCWRCDTPLIYYAKPSWFIRMSELRDELVQNNESINWVPEHIKNGRFGEWLRGVKDWAISRERYWGTPLPIWECRFKRISENKVQLGCGKFKVISSIQELEEKSGKKVEDAHKPYIDDFTWKCEECDGTMERVPEVLDVWFDSGAMPLAQFGYPSSVSPEEKQRIEGGTSFPADYICEAIDQTRGWFYTLHAVANLLAKAGVVKEGRAYKNVICLGHILDAKGKKMSKSKGNIVDSFEMFDRYGADALRWLLFSINQPGLPKRFDEKGMRDVQNRVFRMLWNSYVFFVTYAEIDRWEPKTHAIASSNLLDRWILSELQTLVKNVDARLNAYDVYGSTSAIESFIDNLSNWYIRRSRKRFWKSEDDTDKNSAYTTLHYVLVTLSKLMSPFTPFIAEEMYRNLTGEASVHLADYPVADEKFIDEQLNDEMRKARETVRKGLQRRADDGIKVRQPLQMLSIKYDVLTDLLDIIKEEVNVKNIIVNKEQESNIALDTNMTPELILEGEAREVIRAIQEGRKKAGFNVEDRIVLGYAGMEDVFIGDAKENTSGFQEMIAHEILATGVQQGELIDTEYASEVTLEGKSFHFWLKRV